MHSAALSEMYSIDNKSIERLLPSLRNCPDSVTYYNLLNAALSSYLYPVNQSLSKKDTRKLLLFLPKLYDGGMYFFFQGNDSMALKLFSTVIDFGKKNKVDKFPTRWLGQSAYCSSLLLYGRSQYKEACNMAKIAMTDSDITEDASEIELSSLKKMMNTPDDSLMYYAELLTLHSTFLHNTFFLFELADYYNSSNQYAKLSSLADTLLLADSLNKQAWYFKGLGLLHQDSLEQALPFLRKAVSLDSCYEQPRYALAQCYSVLADSKASRGNARNSCLALAIQQLTVLKTIDPNQINVDWMTLWKRLRLLTAKKDRNEKSK